jgi:hypothetical protein
MNMRLLSVLFLFVLFSGCTEKSEDLNDPTSTLLDAQAHWRTGDLTNFSSTQSTISHYDFDASKLRGLVENKKTSYFWFALGMNNESQIILTAKAVDNKGKEIGTISSKIISKKDFSDDLSILSFPQTYSKQLLDLPVVGKHLIPYKSGGEYISRWEEALQKNDFSEIISYGAERYYQFGVEREVVGHMTKKPDVKSVALFWGVTNEGELTTVFIKKGLNKNLLLDNNMHSIKSGEENGVYDVSRPSPPFDQN